VVVTVPDAPLSILPAYANDAVSVLKGRGPVCLVCEHASERIPNEMNHLGLSPADRHAHAVYDIGAAHLARKLMARIGGTLVMATYSRLLCDLNRPPEATDAMPERVEVIEVPGNRNLSPEHRAARIREIYDPFHAALSETLDTLTAPVLVTIHSFTPTWHGVKREAEIGFLHDADPTLAKAMCAAYAGPHRADLNVPYSAADGVTHTLAKHGTARGIPNVMIEVRNDLLTNDETFDPLVEDLAAAIETALEQVGA
jgi:predicted N-formylglutamate amidohydrolase